MSKTKSGTVVDKRTYRKHFKKEAGASVKRHAIFCTICGCITATMRLREARQIVSICPACREVMRRLKLAGERDAVKTKS